MEKEKSERKSNSSLREQDARKRMVSPTAKRPRRKKRSGAKENLSSSSLRLSSPAGSDYKDESKLKDPNTNDSNGKITSHANSKQILTTNSQTLSSLPVDKSTPRKTQIRRRIRSQSKLSDMVTSSSNESLLSNK